MSWIELQPLIAQAGSLALLALALNILVGTTNLLQIGIAGFFALGAYSAGLTTIYTLEPSWGYANYIPGILVAVVLSVTVAFLMGLPILRLRGDYFAIATLAFGEIMRLFLEETAFPGGFYNTSDRKVLVDGEIVTRPVEQEIGKSSGIGLPDNVSVYYPDYDDNVLANDFWWLWTWLLVIVAYVLLRNIKHSRFGRAFFSIGEDEIAAKAMGVNIPYAKAQAFMLSSGLAGLAGAIYMYSSLIVSPANFTIFKSIEILLVVVLGGMGSLSGCILAAIILLVLPQMYNHIDLRSLKFLPEAMQKPLSEYNQIFYALLLIVLIRLVPNGLFGRQEIPRWLYRMIRKIKGGGGRA